MLTERTPLPAPPKPLPTETSPFLEPLPSELALHVIRNLSGHDLLEVQRVNRHAHALVLGLLRSVDYWRSLGSQPGTEPTLQEVSKAISLVRDTERQFTILDMPLETSPLSWRILTQLKCVSREIGSDPRAVAVKAAKLGDADLCMKALNSVTFSDRPLTLCMDEAVRGRHLPIVERLFICGATVSLDNFRDAIEAEQITIFEKLFAQSPLLITQINNDERQKALHLATKYGKTDTIIKLVKLGCSVNAFNRDGQTALHIAARYGHTDAIRTLVDRNADMNATYCFGETALHEAAKYGHTDVIRTLVEMGCAVDVTTTFDQTALHTAARFGQTDSIIALLDLECPIDAARRGGKRALHFATIGGHTEAIRTLVDRNADMNAIDDKGQTALHTAAIYGYTSNLIFLVTHGCKIDASDKDGSTPLHMAAAFGMIDTIEALVKYGCSVDKSNFFKQNALHLAAKNGHTGAIKVLVDHGCPLDAGDKDGATPLHHAAMGSRIDLIYNLVKLGCPIRKTNSKEQTALDLAISLKNFAAVRALKDLEKTYEK